MYSHLICHLFILFFWNMTLSYHHIISYHIIFIPWIRTELQNPYGYGNSQFA